MPSTYDVAGHALFFYVFFFPHPVFRSPFFQGLFFPAAG